MTTVTTQPDLRSVIGARVRELRTEQRLSQEEVAQLAGVVVKTIANLEAGRIMPRHKTRRGIAAALGVKVEDLEAVAS